MPPGPRISGYVPCHNNAGTVIGSAQSLIGQGASVEEVFIVDDGSTDASAARARANGFRVIELAANLGRGTARATAMEAAKGDLVLSCDATMTLASDFLEKALPHFADERVAAVFGRVHDPAPSGMRSRWRSRHLLKEESNLHVKHGASLSTWGVLLRKQAVMEVGNFDRSLRHSEDAELGQRLLARGFDVVFEPAARLQPSVVNTIPQLMERYWRWNVGKDEELSARHYLKLVSYSIRVLVRRDLAAGDPGAALLSLLMPHYFLWRRWKGPTQRK